ncbi:MAG: hypothetical protein R3257_07905, partial [bacterium]|nr:hypothetical protein [bacterium]
YSKGVDALPQREWDLVITMGCGDRCPLLKAKKKLDWPIPDPIGQSPEVFRQVAKDLERRIRELFAQET